MNFYLDHEKLDVYRCAIQFVVLVDEIVENLQVVLRIVVDEIRKRLVACGPDIPNAQIGAVSFIQHFGNTLNLHPHFHLIVADGLFTTDGNDLLFHEARLTPDDIADTQDGIRKRVLRYFSDEAGLIRTQLRKCSPMITVDFLSMQRYVFPVGIEMGWNA